MSNCEWSNPVVSASVSQSVGRVWPDVVGDVVWVESSPMAVLVVPVCVQVLHSKAVAPLEVGAPLEVNVSREPVARLFAVCRNGGCFLVW